MTLRRVISLETINKNEMFDLITDCQSVLARWSDYFPHQFNVYGVIDVRQTEIHTEEPLVAKPSDFEVKMAIEKLKRHN
jgi:hypothetical protein